MLLHLPKFRITDETGTPYPSAKLYIYQPGTTTEITPYQDYLFATPHANPVEADSEGLFPSIYIRTDINPSVRVIAKDQNDVAIADYDIDRITLVPEEVSDLGVNGDLVVTGTSEFQDEVEIQNAINIRRTVPNLSFEETDASTNEKVWDLNVESKIFSLRTRTDAFGSGKNVLVVTRGTGTALSSIDIGNATDSPTVNINGQPHTTTGSFTGTLVGVNPGVTGTINYVKTGRIVTLYVAANVVGTSNTTALSLTGAPAAVLPVANLSIPCSFIRDDTNAVMGSAYIATGGAITFGVSRTDGLANFVQADESGFTNSGSKGILQGWSITYPTAT